jgi:Tol biopolymer transport system component/DNA-binding winged helix-turn-helix (wHTH) protein
MPEGFLKPFEEIMKDMRDLRYRFDAVEIDVSSLKVTVNSEIRPLEPKSFRLLLFLAENAGRVLPKEEIMAAVWPGTFVSDNSLARAITQVRKALDDDPRSPRYIETIPTVGYRFIAELQASESQPEAPDAVPAAPAPRLPDTSGTDNERQRAIGHTRGTKRWQSVAAVSVVLALLVIGATLWMRALAGRAASTALRNITFTQLTDEPGQELDPSLPPDGKSVIYAGRASGNWDIYFLRVNGKNPVNLTRESIADDTQPVFSPDGEQIAFRSERDGGGIFVMGATGENVKRITDFGYNPAWSPDGREIAFASTIAEPESRLSSQTQLFTVNITTGERRPVTPQTGIAAQPHWSPHGYRIAYWAQVQGRVNVWTIPAGGGDAVRVTNDASVDWNPVWSPDGAYLYFASDRGGSMNLWRVQMNEKSGKVLGEIAPVTTPSTYAADISFSRTGRQMAYIQRTQISHISRVGFDPARETTVGQPEPVTQGSRSTSTPNVSPDGEWIAGVESSKQGNLLVVRRDGSGLRHLTDDVYRNRIPVWSPDGKTLAFTSNRRGRVDIWTIRPDGGSLRQLTYTLSGSITRPVWSPDGKRLMYSLMNGTPFVIEVDKPWISQAPQAVPAALKEPDTGFEATSWSPDGRRLAGFQLRADGKYSGIGIYSFENGDYTRVTDFGQSPFWLRDGRRLIFSSGPSRDGAIYLMDSQARKVRQIISMAPNEVGGDAISPDNRWIYFALTVTEADIWMANLQ